MANMTRTGRGCIILAALALLLPGAGAAASSGDNALSSFYEVHAGAFRIVHRAFKSAFGKPAFCPPGNEIISLREVTGGGMRGGFSRFEIARTPEGKARITRDVRAWHSAPQTIKIYETDISYLRRIEAVVREEVDFRLSDAPYPEFRVLDAPTTSFDIRCSNHEFWSTGSERTLPRSFYNTMKKITDIMEEGLAHGRVIRDEVICNDENHCQRPEEPGRNFPSLSEDKGS
jgi:hypothetical protein